MRTGTPAHILDLREGQYRQANPDGYQYSRFCELYQRWRRKQDVVLRQEHKAGEKLFVDWAGTTIPIHDPRAGPVQQAHLFVAVLGASSYTYAEATADEQLASWIGAHVHAFEFYQGVPKLVVPDFVPRNIIRVMWRLALCALRRREVIETALRFSDAPHNGFVLVS